MKALLICTIPLLFAIACGGSRVVVIVPPSPATTTNSPPSPDVGTAHIDACKLISLPQLASTLGGDWQIVELLIPLPSDVAGSICEFAQGNPLLDLNTPQVWLNVSDLSSNPEQEFDNRHAGALLHVEGDHDVSDLGDDAYWSRNNGLNVRKGSIDLGVRVEAHGPPNEAESIAVAQVIINNLPE